MKKTPIFLSVLLMIALLVPGAAQAETLANARQLPTMATLMDYLTGEAWTSEDGIEMEGYSDIERDTLDAYLDMITPWGYVATKLNMSTEEQEIYLLYPVGTQAQATEFVYGELDYYPQDKVVIFSAPQEGHLIGDSSELENDWMYYENHELNMPEEVLGCLLPQAYAIFGTSPSMSGQIGMDSFFDGAMCWHEVYDAVTLDQLQDYITCMYQFGCDVTMRQWSFDDQMGFDYSIFDFLQEDETVVSVMWARKDDGQTNVSVYYNPSVTFDLRSENDLIQIMGL